jgi:hypothetical protein
MNSGNDFNRRSVSQVVYHSCRTWPVARCSAVKIYQMARDQVRGSAERKISNGQPPVSEHLSRSTATTGDRRAPLEHPRP